MPGVDVFPRVKRSNSAPLIASGTPGPSSSTRTTAPSGCGATRTQMFFKITLPLIRGPVAVAMTNATVTAFNLFDEAWVLASSSLDTRPILVQIYLERIATYDPASRRVTDAEGRVFYGLNSYLYVNPQALTEARASDAARHHGNIERVFDDLTVRR